MVNLEEYKKTPNKCRLSFKTITKIIELKNVDEVTEKHRNQRLNCFKTNVCKWEDCIYEATLSSIKKLKCPECNSRLKINKAYMVCTNCGYGFEVIRFE